MPVLTGAGFRLEPLTVEHAEGYLGATGTASEAADIFRWQSPAGGALTTPATVDDARQHITSALAGRARGVRLAYAPIDLATGLFAGTTSIADPDPRLRALTIGFGAVRVSLVTDIRNVRAQKAIERLGATREGVLRKHRLRADGSWRDTVLYALLDDEWPAVKRALTVSP